MARMTRLGCVWIGTMIVALSALAAEKAPREEPGEETRARAESAEAEAPRVELSIYVPPPRGTPRVRTGGGTRAPSQLPELVALVPDHVARTAAAQPTLAWYASGEAAVPVELTVLREDAVEPLVEERIAPAIRAGFGSVSLARFGVELEEGVAYQWFVALVPDPRQRDRDVIAGGAIQRVPEPRLLETELSVAAMPHRVLGRAGLWYDALASLTERIDAGEGELRSERTALLAEVGIVLEER